MKKLVLDIGGTLIKYAVMDKEAKIFQRGELPTPLDSIESLMKKITELYNSLKDEVNGIAISMPGNIDTKTGQIYSPGALAYNANVNIIDKTLPIIEEVRDLWYEVDKKIKSGK